MSDQTDLNRRAIISKIYDERCRQISEEGYNPGDDDEAVNGELADAAAYYAATAQPEEDLLAMAHNQSVLVQLWPWEASLGAKAIKSRPRQLIVAAALIVAELERLERAGEKI